jgi:hypothetical protein
MAEVMPMLAEALQHMTRAAGGPKRVIRDENNQIVGVEPVMNEGQA